MRIRSMGADTTTRPRPLSILIGGFGFQLVGTLLEKLDCP
jgi:hypothetical protein